MYKFIQKLNIPRQSNFDVTTPYGVVIVGSDLVPAKEPANWLDFGHTEWSPELHKTVDLPVVAHLQPKRQSEALLFAVLTGLARPDNWNDLQLGRFCVTELEANRIQLTIVVTTNDGQKTDGALAVITDGDYRLFKFLSYTASYRVVE